MGAGRTELAMSVFGRTYGANISGTVHMHGKPTDTSTVGKAIAAGIAYATEDRKRYGLNLIQPIKTNIVAAALSKLSRRGSGGPQ
jgi:monosaccharide ABC transporter ATP-binding protein, CUT2 family (TC 3.A.1.2.-)